MLSARRQPTELCTLIRSVIVRPAVIDMVGISFGSHHILGLNTLDAVMDSMLDLDF